MSNILGATVTDSIVPFFTTHIIASKIDIKLKNTLNSLQSVSHGMHNEGEMFTVELVTIDWLKECLLKKDHISEEQFKP